MDKKIVDNKEPTHVHPNDILNPPNHQVNGTQMATAQQPLPMGDATPAITDKGIWAGKDSSDFQDGLKAIIEGMKKEYGGKMSDSILEKLVSDFTAINTNIGIRYDKGIKDAMAQVNANGNTFSKEDSERMKKVHESVWNKAAAEKKEEEKKALWKQVEAYYTKMNKEAKKANITDLPEVTYENFQGAEAPRIMQECMARVGEQNDILRRISDGQRFSNARSALDNTFRRTFRDPYGSSQPISQSVQDTSNSQLYSSSSHDTNLHKRPRFNGEFTKPFSGVREEFVPPRSMETKDVAWYTKASYRRK